jgi:hypothetical protein
MWKDRFPKQFGQSQAGKLFSHPGEWFAVFEEQGCKIRKKSQAVGMGGMFTGEPFQLFEPRISAVCKAAAKAVGNHGSSGRRSSNAR